VNTLILGIESSCDDTSAAILWNNKILSNVTAGQSIHEEYGGVVPELASRAHQENIVPVVVAAIKKAKVKMEDIQAVAYTQGPGLMGSLVVGTAFAKSFALARGIPLIPVNHMKAHILAHFIEDANPFPPTFPFLCLTVSGGHTQIVQVNSAFEMNIIGKTIDDAAGEAFDKIAKMLGLPYPGGPLIDQLALTGNPNAFQFSKPRIPELNFSFSGLKTSVLYFLQKMEKENPAFKQEHLNDLCASVQQTIVAILLEKINLAVMKTGITQVALAGGVSANSGLRNVLKEKGEKSRWKIFIPPLSYCTDNAAMVAIAGKLLWESGKIGSQHDAAMARMEW
jgi:N6-L-threonylcarbamoyladenine synthase